jgi:hypothetical protein
MVPCGAKGRIGLDVPSDCGRYLRSLHPGNTHWQVLVTTLDEKVMAILHVHESYCQHYRTCDRTRQRAPDELDCPHLFGPSIRIDAG